LYRLLNVRVTRYADLAKEIGSSWQMKTVRIVEIDLVLPLAQVAEGYRAMDERRAIKTLLQP
jgi:hypothetical protein